MKSYVPHTENERREMLESIGVKSIDELFSDVPASLLLKRRLNIGEGMSEVEIRKAFLELVNKNRTDLKVFRGAGAYNHYIPSLVLELSARSELYTAYTPYQAEMSQGMLQAIFEYQTFICRLTGLDVSNASVYDGATAAAEAMVMMLNATRKKKLLLSAGLHPEVIETVKTYAHSIGVEIVVVPLNEKGMTDIAQLKANAEGFAGLIAQNPNFFGIIEDMKALADCAHELGGLFTAYVNPITLGMLKRPADYGADIAIGDGQPLGVPMSFGGPYFGFMACTNKLIRNLPGRIAGQTEDAEGNRAFVLTLQAREQHIRRDKASSNICSNQMLCAIMASIYMAVMGKHGIKEVAEQCLQKAHYLADGLTQIKGFKLRYASPFFHEFVTDCEYDAEKLNDALKAKGFMGGLPLGRVIKGEHGMLWCVTEMNSRQDIDDLICAVESIVKEGLA
jgi:glycine dehydrogenase subunit 1